MALKKAQLSLDDMSLIEINEAFAVQALACAKVYRPQYGRLLKILCSGIRARHGQAQRTWWSYCNGVISSYT